MDISIQWHSPDAMWAAVFLRDGEPWHLDGALVGLGGTIPKAVDDLLRIADYLVRHGANFLTNGMITDDDRNWLYRLLDQGGDGAARRDRYMAWGGR
jgi:hypothetical protein